MQAFKQAADNEGSPKGGAADRGRVAGLLLAAGESSRMGRLKQLLPLGEDTLLNRVLREALSSDLDRVVLVLGHRAGEIVQSLGDLAESEKLLMVENRRYKRGISSSIAAGLSRVEKTHDHVMILLADMPDIRADLIDRLLRRCLTSGSPLGAVEVGGKRSHPVFFSRRLYPELNRLKGDEGARGLFRTHRDEVCLVKADDFYDDRDLDTLEDYETYRNAFSRPAPKA